MATSTRPDGVTPGKTSVRSIALPLEHGGWGFTLEPVLLGLLVAPSASAWELAIASLGVFLARRPVKLVLTDLVRHRWLSRTRVAAIVGGVFGATALAGVAGAFVTAGPQFLIPYAAAVPAALLALRADSTSKSRSLRAELAGAIAMGATVTAIALADGWAYPVAFGLWLVLIARAATTISLVRAQIRRVHGRLYSEGRVYAVCITTLGVVTALAAIDMVPWLSVVAIAAIGLLAYASLARPPVPARVVGWTQMATGLVVVWLTAAGVWLGW
jgi:hypothetical protein